MYTGSDCLGISCLLVGVACCLGNGKPVSFKALEALDDLSAAYWAVINMFASVTSTPHRFHQTEKSGMEAGNKTFIALFTNKVYQDADNSIYVYLYSL